MRRVNPGEGKREKNMRLKLSDMPDALRRRVEAALAKQGGADRAKTAAHSSGGAGVAILTPGEGAECVSGEISGRARGPNKTEAEYNRLHLCGRGLYEAVTLRLPGGSRYTPDWVVIGDGGAVELHEVKGSYRFGSHGRAVTAFREAVAAFPCFAFVWVVHGKGGVWSVKRYAAGSANGGPSGEHGGL